MRVQPPQPPPIFTLGGLFGPYCGRRLVCEEKTMSLDVLCGRNLRSDTFVFLDRLV